MGQKILVERHLADGERLLRQLQEDGYPFAAAAWFHDEDREKWYFYLVTSLLDAEGSFGAYGKLNESCDKLPDLSIQPLDLRVFSPSSPEGLGLQSVAANLSPGALHANFRTMDFKRGTFGDAYVYPLQQQLVSA